MKFLTMSATHIFSSIGGKIEILLMSAPDMSDRDQIQRILAMLRVLREDMRLVVWCNSPIDRKALWKHISREYPEATILQNHIDAVLPTHFRCLVVSPIEAVERYTHWVRDPFLFYRKRGRSIGFVGSVGAKMQDQSWADKYFSKLKLDTISIHPLVGFNVPVPLGNVLADQRFVLVGFRQYEQWLREHGRDRANKILKRSLGSPLAFRQVIAIGEKSEYEPGRLAHIDLYITLTGQYNMHGKYIVLLGECVGLNAAPAQQADLENLIIGINRYLQTVRDQLLAEGFEVRRIPLPLVNRDRYGEAYLCSFNNCLVECKHRFKWVWLPRYSFGEAAVIWLEYLKPLEQEVEMVWKSLGYEVSYVDANFHSIQDESGSLHCITQEILRS